VLAAATATADRKTFNFIGLAVRLVVVIATNDGGVNNLLLNALHTG
jgi:hypothetical protein